MSVLLTARCRSDEYRIISGPVAVELDDVGEWILVHVRSIDSEFGAAHEGHVS